jgi:hypothetical protein
MKLSKTAQKAQAKKELQERVSKRISKLANQRDEHLSLDRPISAEKVQNTIDALNETYM